MKTGHAPAVPLHATPRGRLGRARLLIVGCGDTGMTALPGLVDRMRVIALTSQPERVAELRTAGAHPVVGNLDHAPDLRRLRGLADRVLMLAPPPSTGSDDPRSARLAMALRRPMLGLRPGRASRPQALAGHRRARPALIVANAARQGVGHGPHGQRTRASRPRKVVYASTSGVYGHRQGAWLDERQLPAPTTDRARRRVHAESTWRAIAPARARQPSLQMANWQTTVLRIPGIYGRARLPLDRLRRGLPRLTPEDDVYTNHIEISDLARTAIVAVWRGPAQRVVHAADGQQMKMGDYFDAVADAAGLPRPPRLPAQAVKTAVSPAMWSFMNESRRLDNRRLREELRVRLRFPTVQSALASWFGEPGSGKQHDTQRQ